MNLTTGVWTAVGSGVPMSSEVRALAVLPSSGEVLVGGNFSTAGGAAAQRIAKFNPTTRIWSAVSGVPTTANGVTSLAALPGGDVLVGGGLGTGAANVAKITPAGVWTPFATSLTGGVNGIAVLPGGTEAIVTSYGGSTTAHTEWGRTLWRVDLTTGAMTSAGPHFDPWDLAWTGSVTHVYAFAEDHAGDVYVGGKIESVNGVPTRGLGHYNTKTGAFRAVPGLDGIVGALAVLPNGDVIAGGLFSTAGGVPVTSIARYTPSTGVWSSMGADLAGSPPPPGKRNSLVNALRVLPGGDVLVGGQFDWVGGVRCNGLARYHPTTNTWTPIFGDGDPEAQVDDMDLMPDGRVVILGHRVGPTVYDPITGGLSSLSFPGNVATLDWNASCLAMPNGDVYVTYSIYPYILHRFNAATGVWTAHDLRYGEVIVAIPQSLELVDGASPRVLAVGFSQILRRGNDLYSGSFDPSTGTVNGWPASSPINSDDSWGYSIYTSLTLRDGTVMLGTTGAQRFLEDSDTTAKWMPGFVRLYNGAGTTRTVITSSPAPRNASPGETVEFSVAAVGYGQLRYEWLKDGTAINATANPSAGTATLTLTNVSPADAAAYSCRVFNICNLQATSAAVWLTLDSPSCLGDYNQDGGVDGTDLEAFFVDWEAGNAAADVNEDGGVEGADLEVFFTRWEAGC